MDSKIEIDDNMVKDLRFFLDWRKKKIIKNKTIIDVRNLFEHGEENYYKPASQQEKVIFGVTIALNMKVTVIEIKRYWLNKWSHT